MTAVRWISIFKHLPFVLFPDVVFFREVNEVNHWFGCQKQVFVQHFNLRQRYTSAEKPHFSKTAQTKTSEDK